VSVSPGSGQFEICDSDSVVASGRISLLTDSEQSDDECPMPVVDTEPLPLNSDDIYKELRLRGYDYGPSFRGIHSADGTGRFYWQKDTLAVLSKALDRRPRKQYQKPVVAKWYWFLEIVLQSGM